MKNSGLLKLTNLGYEQYYNQMKRKKSK